MNNNINKIYWKYKGFKFMTETNFLNKKFVVAIVWAMLFPGVGATKEYTPTTLPTVESNFSGFFWGFEGSIPAGWRGVDERFYNDNLAAPDGMFEGNDGEKENGKNAKDSCPKSGNPVVIATGNKIETEVDFVSDGEMGLYLRRSWNRHQGDNIGMFERWKTIYDSTLTVSGCFPYPGEPECTPAPDWTYIFARRSDGRSIQYNKSSDGIYYEKKASPVSKIVRQADGTWLLYSEDHMIERYSSGGMLKELKNEHGVGWTLTYGGDNGTLLQRATHTNGRYIEFTWAPKNAQYGYFPRVTKVRDPQGNYYEYTYTQDAYGKLKTVKLPGIPVTTVTYHYGYEEGVSGNAYTSLVGKSYNGTRYSTFAYDADGLATKTEHAGGIERFMFSYMPDTNGGMKVEETNPLGKKAVYAFSDDKLVSVTGQPSAHCAASYREITYDANGYQDLVSDFKDNIINYDYDASGRLAKKIEAVGKPESRTTTYAWDTAKNRILRETIAGLRETSFTYDANGRVASTSIKNLSSNGVVGQVQTTTYTYTLHPNGLVATIKIDGPIAGTGDVVTETYSTTGDLVSVANSLGHTTTYSGYNGLGLPGSITGPNGEKRSFVYDARGRKTEEKAYRNGGTQTTSYAYDGFGRLAAVTLPDGVKRYYHYDIGGRLLTESQSEAGGTFAQRIYTYNAMSKPTSITVQRTTAQPLQGTQP